MLQDSILLLRQGRLPRVVLPPKHLGKRSLLFCDPHVVAVEAVG